MQGGVKSVMSAEFFLVVTAISIIGVAVAVDLSNRDLRKQMDRIEKTKLLTTNIRSESSFRRYYERCEVTFMVYYKDGTHEAKTIDTSDRKTYDAYMSKLEL